MLRPIRDAMSGAFTSFDTLADALITAAPSLEWPARRSLSAKIGELDRGVKTWWQRRPAQRNALLELLGIPDADIGVYESKSDENVFHFKDFPELPPLHLSREAVLRIGHAIPRNLMDSANSVEEWLKLETTGIARRSEPTGITWLFMADGMGRSLLFAELAEKRCLDAIRVRTLADIGHRLDEPKPLVVKLDKQAGLSDLHHLLRRPCDAGMLIIAPTPFPNGNSNLLTPSLTWEFLSSKKSDRDFLALSNPNSFIGQLSGLHRVTDLQWELERDWQRLFLNWIEARLNRLQPDTLFSAEGLLGWIEAFDPLKQWISTPEELMVLCRISHRKRYLDFPKVFDRRVADVLMDAAISLKPGQKRVFRWLAERRWQANDLPWDGALPETEWRTLARGTESVSQEVLLAIAEAPNRERRREMALTIAQQSTHGIIDSLIEDGYLQHEGGAHYDLSPPALANLIVRDWLLENILTSPLNTWALGCFDASRRQLIDATLDGLSVEELSVLAEAICHAPLWAAETIGASESLVFAIARRLVIGRIPATESVRQCFEQVLSRLDRIDAFPARFPLTRSRDTNDDQLAWLVTCWAFSLSDPPSGIELNHHDAWQFPGWFEELPHTVFLLLPLSFVTYDELKWSWRSLIQLGKRIINHWQTPPADPPVFLAPLLLSAAAMGRWPAQASWWQSVMNNNDLENTLLAELTKIGRDAALRLWPSFLRYEIHGKDKTSLAVDKVRCICSASRIWILERLQPDDVISSLDEESLHYLRTNPSSLPPSVRRALLNQLPNNSPGALSLLSCCDDLDGDELTRWLGGDTVLIAAERIWALPADEILRVIDRLAGEDEENMAMLLNNCPDSQIEIALGALHKNPKLLSRERLRQWVQLRLPNSRHYATSLISLTPTESSQK